MLVQKLTTEQFSLFQISGIKMVSDNGEVYWLQPNVYKELWDGLFSVMNIEDLPKHFFKDISPVFQSMLDEYAIKILQFLIDNSDQFDFISGEEPANVILDSIKRHLK